MAALLAGAFMYYTLFMHSSNYSAPSKQDAVKPVTGSSSPSTYLQPGPKHIQGSGSTDKELSKAAPQFIIENVKSLYAISPKGISPLQNYDRSIMDDLGDINAHATTERLGQFLQVPEADLQELKRLHAHAIAQLPNEVPAGLFKGRGIVMTAGGPYFPVLLAGLRWLRNMGCKTPVEVYMEDPKEYEKEYCEVLFPKIGAECVVLSEVYGTELFKALNTKYVFKLLAILVSKFDEVYFMDADSFPLFPLEEVWGSTPYKNTSYVLNSDFWPRYVSPKFYEIAGIQLGGRERGNPNDELLLQADRKGAVPGVSTESGQLAVKKSQHIRSLMLATWYCLYGPNYWFPLLMQGGPGEGDKDTFSTAAALLNEPFYQTMQRPGNLQFITPSGKVKGFAMIQPHPQSDWNNHVEGLPFNKTFFTLHSNSVKMNPKHLLRDSESIRGMAPLKGARFFGNLDNIEHETGRRDDIELRMFEATRDVACEWAYEQKLIPRDWVGEDVGRFCTEMNKHVRWLRENPDDGHPPPGYD